MMESVALVINTITIPVTEWCLRPSEQTLKPLEPIQKQDKNK